jgi:hypothetical protein
MTTRICSSEMLGGELDLGIIITASLCQHRDFLAVGGFG